MKGHIRERSPGKWAVVLDLRDPETGKRRRKWHTFIGTKREAQKECARLITTLQNGDYVEPAKETLAQFFERWLEHIRSQVSPRSHERYTEIARKNLAPLLGGAVLTKLRPEQISAAYGKALVSGRRDGKGALRLEPSTTCTASCGRRWARPSNGASSFVIRRIPSTRRKSSD